MTAVRRVAALSGLLGVLAALTLVLVIPAPAWAHIGLASSSPTQGASIASLPTTVTLEFTGELQDIAEVVVTDPDGLDRATGEAQVSGATVDQEVAPGAEPGQYALAYRVTSTDGHVLTGRISFAVAVPFEGARSAAPADQAGGTPAAGDIPPTTSPSATTATTGTTTGTSWPARDVVVPAALLALALAAWLLSRRTPHPTSRRTT